MQLVTSLTRDSVSNVIDIQRYSSIDHLLKVMAMVMRFIYNSGAPKRGRRCGDITSDEKDEAMMAWLTDVQRDSFKDEVDALKNRHKLQPLVSQLKLYLDDAGIIRCMGRLQNADLSDGTNCPILWPKRGYLTKLVIRVI